MATEAGALLTAGLLRLGVAADAAVVAAILQHLELVRQVGRTHNLTAITEPAEMAVKHGVDSGALGIWQSPAPGARLLDVGSGAGFPGVVLALLYPDTEVVLLEATQKKARFLMQAIAELRLAGRCSVHWGRAEDLAHDPAWRAGFDLVCARAVAPLCVLAELCLPFVRVGGHFVAWKGAAVDAEIAAAQRALRVLGAGKVQRLSYDLGPAAGQRCLVVVAKERPSDRKYPRRAGTPQKQPL